MEKWNCMEWIFVFAPVPYGSRNMLWDFLSLHFWLLYCGYHTVSSLGFTLYSSSIVLSALLPLTDDIRDDDDRIRWRTANGFCWNNDQNSRNLIICQPSSLLAPRPIYSCVASRRRHADDNAPDRTTEFKCWHRTRHHWLTNAKPLTTGSPTRLRFDDENTVGRTSSSGWPLVLKPPGK